MIVGVVGFKCRVFGVDIVGIVGKICLRGWDRMLVLFKLEDGGIECFSEGLKRFFMLFFVIRKFM